VQLIDKLLGIDKLKNEIKAYQATTTIQLYNQIFPSWQSYKAVAAYHVMDMVNAVVNKLAKTAASLPIYGYNQQGEDLPETDKLVIFLESLTYVQKIQLYTWLYLADECFVYKEKTLGVNGTVQKIHFLNPSYVTIIVTDTFPQEIEKYRYCDTNSGVDLILEKDEVVFIHGFNPTLDYYQKWRGLSKIDVLKQRLTRMESNMKNSVGQMQNGGVPGVMFAKDIPHNATGKAALDGAKDNFGRFIKNSENKGAPFMQAGEWGYFQIGSSLVDMDSIELEKIDNKAVCNVWGISDILFNSDTASTESNVKEMIRQMYTNAVMPYTTMVDDAFNNELVTDFGVGYRRLRTDYSDVPELQTSMKEKIDALNAAMTGIPNDHLEALGYDRVDDPAMDMPFIKSGWLPLDQFEPLPPIE